MNGPLPPLTAPPPPFPLPTKKKIDKPGSARGASGSAWERLGALKVYALATQPRRAALPARARGALLAQTRGGDSRTSARRSHSYVRARRYRTHARWRQSYAREAARAVQRRPEGSHLGRLSVRVQPAFPPSRLPVIPARIPARLFPARLFARFLPVFPPAFPAVLAPFLPHAFSPAAGSRLLAFPPAFPPGSGAEKRPPKVTLFL